MKKTKKTILLTACLLYSITSIGQTIELQDVASVTPPSKKLIPISKDKIPEFAKEKFRGKMVPYDILNNSDDVYAVDDILVRVRAFKGPANPDFTKAKKSFDILNNGVKGGASSIETIDNKVVYIMWIPDEYLGTCYFACINKHHNVTITGKLEFNAGDEAKARSVLEDIIKGLKFKE